MQVYTQYPVENGQLNQRSDPCNAGQTFLFIVEQLLDTMPMVWSEMRFALKCMHNLVFATTTPADVLAALSKPGFVTASPQKIDGCNPYRQMQQVFPKVLVFLRETRPALPDDVTRAGVLTSALIPAIKSDERCNGEFVNLPILVGVKSRRNLVTNEHRKLLCDRIQILIIFRLVQESRFCDSCSFR